MTSLALGVAFALMLVNGLIRASGASLVRTPRADALRDANEGDARAERIAALLGDRPRIQPALGLVNTGFLVVEVIAASWALARSLDGVALFGSLVALAFILVVLGDILPRTLGRSRPITLAYRFSWLLRPAVAFGDAAADLVVDLDDDDVEDQDDEAEAERALISQVLEFTDSIVREVMVPRPDMVTIEADAGLDIALATIVEAGKSRIPVCGEDTDDILGVLYARDLLQINGDGAQERRARDLTRDAYFVPETKRVPELLREMQANQVHMAIVIDEFGSTAGLVTIEDLLEELVGEIADEYDDEEPLIVAQDDGSYLIDARLDIDELGELIGIDVPDEDWDTVGGLLLGLAGRVPDEGDQFELGGRTLTVERVQGRRVARVRLS